MEKNITHLPGGAYSSRLRTPWVMRLHMTSHARAGDPGILRARPTNFTGHPRIHGFLRIQNFVTPFLGFHFFHIARHHWAPDRGRLIDAAPLLHVPSRPRSIYLKSLEIRKGVKGYKFNLDYCRAKLPWLHSEYALASMKYQK